MKPPAFDTWRLQACDADGQPYGAAVLVGKQTALTCAHVVQAICRAARVSAGPKSEISVLFATVPGARRVPGRVVEDGWFPIDHDGTGDLAVLDLEEPAPDSVDAATLRDWGGSDGPVRAYGYPSSIPTGVYARGRPVGTGGPGSVWVQLDGGTTGWPVEPGFSGAGVATADESGAVLGIVVSAAKPYDRRVGWMLPVETISTYWPSLRSFTARRSTSHTGPRSIALRLLPYFAAVPALANPQTRQMIVAELRPDIGRSASRHADANFDIVGILKSCLRFPGGLGELVDVLRVFERESAEMADLDSVLQQLPPGAVR